MQDWKMTDHRKVGVGVENAGLNFGGSNSRAWKYGADALRRKECWQAVIQSVEHDRCYRWLKNRSFYLREWLYIGQIHSHSA